MSNLFQKLIESVNLKQDSEKYIRSQITRLLTIINKPNLNCIDVGAHKGEILKIFLKRCPRGKHFGFEPVLPLYDAIKYKYGSAKCSIMNIAISDRKGESIFSYIKNEPTLSSLININTQNSNLDNFKLLVRTDTLDNVIPLDTKIDFINIDVEGAELLVLNGAENLINKHKPTIIFEYKEETAKSYNTTLNDFYDLLVTKNSYSLYTLNSFLSYNKSLNMQDIEKLQKTGNFRYLIATTIKLKKDS